MSLIIPEKQIPGIIRKPFETMTDICKGHEGTIKSHSQCNPESSRHIQKCCIRFMLHSWTLSNAFIDPAEVIDRLSTDHPSSKKEYLSILHGSPAYFLPVCISPFALPYLLFVLFPLLSTWIIFVIRIQALVKRFSGISTTIQAEKPPCNPWKPRWWPVSQVFRSLEGEVSPPCRSRQLDHRQRGKFQALIRVYVRQLAAPHILPQKTCWRQCWMLLEQVTTFDDRCRCCEELLPVVWFKLVFERSSENTFAAMGCNSSTTKGHVPSSAVTDLPHPATMMRAFSRVAEPCWTARTRPRLGLGVFRTLIQMKWFHHDPLHDSSCVMCYGNIIRPSSTNTNTLLNQRHTHYRVGWAMRQQSGFVVRCL